LPCRLFQPTTAFDGKLHYTACCVSGAVKLPQHPIKCTIVVIYFLERWQNTFEKSKKNLKIIQKMFGSSEIYPDICSRQLGIIPQKF